ncbi:MAG: ABC transporter ATP-binding protein [Tissierellia bacterium]|nr:ABC transporter ATP-binding protein [Tissierellia bacterium]
MWALSVNNLTKNFGGIKAIRDINVNIEKGKIIGIIGPNGAGKTTFFNLLTGIYSPTTGEIVYNLDSQVRTKDLKPHKIVHYGIARTFQNIRLFKEMTVLDNILIGFHNRLKYGVGSTLLRLPSYYKAEKSTHEEALELLDKFDLLNKKDELAKNLPYGDQRKLEIARALAAKPKLLLLDEPAAGMNPIETKELRDLINWIREAFELTIILIEHDMSLVMNICEEILVFDYGNLVAQGSPEEIQNNERVIKAYLGEEVEEC